MKNEMINDVLNRMASHLDNYQMLTLKNVLLECFAGVSLEIEASSKTDDFILNNATKVNNFLSSKKVEGCSNKSLGYYKKTIDHLLQSIAKDITRITTEDLRTYLAEYHDSRKVSKVTIDNIRRIFSSFFSWLEDEELIMKSPVRRIHKVKTNKLVKETYSDEMLEKMRDSCVNTRDLALIDMLASTGMRVGELVKLNKTDVNFNERECVVLGKGSKERLVYFDARSKIHLMNYLNERHDNDPALFVSINSPHRRLEIGGVEARLKKIGKTVTDERVYPHKFRRTLATAAIDKGMPIEQVQHLLGHQRIDTTLQYAMVNQVNVKNAHRKYIG
ncbi:tyrosine-type recombinase/integrase [Sporolactobacillus sp. CQH2019]|uniref:site-specific tyrosine recombinase/integron integrase n=1 Tax=Sporolactobacillus sp. CQH2019 TaxID=3023512 RepID=UPI00236795E0|nr:site-specific tyrosine recombinase/integron integrase [Sporolactobacillus sp. CQH2019]MDD9149833.1 tyrosine-type recombinase/integrase [Sporolactobacillus sp. CQH2019]